MMWHYLTPAEMAEAQRVGRGAASLSNAEARRALGQASQALPIADPELKRVKAEAWFCRAWQSRRAKIKRRAIDLALREARRLAGAP